MNYIGITGFMKREEIELLLEKLPFPGGRKLMAGVLVSYKALEGKINRPTRYPPLSEIKDIVVPDHRVLYFLHYNTRYMETLGSQLMRLDIIAGNKFDGAQLNMSWPNVEQLRRFKALTPGFLLVLQLNRGCLKEPLISIVNRAQEYIGLCEYVLVDPSGGRGEQISEKNLAVADAMTRIGFKVVVAGGLSAETIEAIDPFVKNNPFISIDAEGRLRDENDALDIEKAAAYLEAAKNRLP